ncbi:hypothetical protein BDK51DRAFT_30477, partial [Blyttiomyces helicus]
MPPKASHKLGFPVFAVAFAPGNPVVLVGGGGGPNNSGVKNSLIAYTVNETTLELIPLAEHQFSKQEDACMSLAVHPKEKTFVAGVNCSAEDVKTGENLNCRVLYMAAEKFSQNRAYKTIGGGQESTDYQKTARFSPDGKFLLTGATDGM